MEENIKQPLKAVSQVSSIISQNDDECNIRLRNNGTIYQSYFVAAQKITNKKERIFFDNCFLKLSLFGEKISENLQENLQNYDNFTQKLLRICQEKKYFFAEIALTNINPNTKTCYIKFLNGNKGKDYGINGGAPKGNQNALKKQPQNNGKTTPDIEEEYRYKNKEEEVEEEVDIKKAENAKNFYGEYGNVFLTRKNYDTLLTCILDENILNELINELSSVIAQKNDRYKPYDEHYPDAHFIHLKNFWKFRYEHPEKFTPEKNVSSSNNISETIDRVFAKLEQEKGG